MSSNLPHVFWLFGLSGAGKSTLSQRLADDLRQNQIGVLAIDGDQLRGGLCSGLGFSDEDRSENLRRAACVAKLGLQSNLNVVASFITPLEAQRSLIADLIGRENLSLVFLDASLETCRVRDVKGLYARAISGDLSNMSGLSASFEVPRAADLVLETNSSSVNTTFQNLRSFALKQVFSNDVSEFLADGAL